MTKTFFIDDNKFTLATIPAQPAGMNTKNKTKNFKYAPQADYEVAETLTDIDLSSQLNVAKGELNANNNYEGWLSGTTAFSFVTESGTALVEGTDYWKTDEGKYTFTKEQAEKVHGVMTNSALPKFADKLVYKTTEFTVSPATGIKSITENIFSGKVFNLQGVEVQPTKGLYIQGGRKVIKN